MTSILTNLFFKGLAPITFALSFSIYRNVCHAEHAPWDVNWDERNSEYLDAIEFEKSLGNCLYRGSRNILLILSGDKQFFAKRKSRLSDLGKEQAEFVSRRLQELKYPYTNIIYAPKSVFARETAHIIQRFFPTVPMSASHLIDDGIPIEPVPTVDLDPELTKNMILDDGRRLETAFHHYFYRPKVGDLDSFDILVCPANVIRYFICRALQFPPEAWHRMTLTNCSITWIQINGDGQVTVVAIGEFNHLPEDKITPRIHKLTC